MAVIRCPIIGPNPIIKVIYIIYITRRVIWVDIFRVCTNHFWIWFINTSFLPSSACSEITITDLVCDILYVRYFAPDPWVGFIRSMGNVAMKCDMIPMCMCQKMNGRVEENFSKSSSKIGSRISHANKEFNITRIPN